MCSAVTTTWLNGPSANKRPACPDGEAAHGPYRRRAPARSAAVVAVIADQAVTVQAAGEAVVAVAASDRVVVVAPGAKGCASGRRGDVDG